ncbi:GGDEF domain-containing protein [Desulfitobacterium sp. Sab5]|uniref:GGDEF domain-containing protein n=1 Tax=Desulfitobacterium nosdiversum TaxID=3375356 RepID=UPI003CF6FFCA
MIILGIFYGITYDYIMPLFTSNLAHCIIQGIVFGFINYFVVIIILKKYSDLKKSNTLLKKNLRIDNLTGLFNRRTFDNDIQNVSLDSDYSIIFIDIDNFRKFNNEFGHQCGDTVLKNVCQTIKTTVRNNDRVYRYGGEEIVVLLNNCDKKNAFQIAEKIRLNITELDNSPFPPITISLGISSYPEDGTEINEIIELSDNALLTAKRSGKNQVAVYSH